MNSKNSKKSDPYRLLLNLTDKIGLKRKDKYIPLSNLIICYIWKGHIRTRWSFIKISSPAWSEELELPDGSCSISNI